MVQNPLRVLGRISITMLGIGVAIGLSALFIWEWFYIVVLPGMEEDAGGTQALVLANYLTLVFLTVTALAAPVVASIIGIFEGLRSSSLKNSLIVGIGCIFGAVLMIVFAAIFIGFTGIESDNGDGPGLLDIIGLAGLSGIASFIGSFVTTKLGNK